MGGAGDKCVKPSLVEELTPNKRPATCALHHGQSGDVLQHTSTSLQPRVQSPTMPIQEVKLRNFNTYARNGCSHGRNLHRVWQEHRQGPGCQALPSLSGVGRHTAADLLHGQRAVRLRRRVWWSDHPQGLHALHASVEARHAGVPCGALICTQEEHPHGHVGDTHTPQPFAARAQRAAERLQGLLATRCRGGVVDQHLKASILQVVRPGQAGSTWSAFAGAQQS